MFGHCSFLVERGKETEARHAIRFFYNCSVETTDDVIEEYKENLKLNAKTMSVVEVFKDKYSRKGTEVGGVISFTSVGNGMAGNSLSTSLFLFLRESRAISRRPGLQRDWKVRKFMRILPAELEIRGIPRKNSCPRQSRVKKAWLSLQFFEQIPWGKAVCRAAPARQ